MKRFEKLPEPVKIGLVKTRNWPIESGAAIQYWHQDEVQWKISLMIWRERLGLPGAGSPISLF